MLIVPITTTSDSSTVTIASAPLGGGPGAAAMLVGALYVFASSTNCWLRQGTAKLVTCVAKANFVDTDFMTITANGTTKIYEFDFAGNGVTVGSVQVNISAATTAASVAAILRTAILANQAFLEVTDNADGTLTIVAPSFQMTITENVANAGFLVAVASMVATVADGSMFVPAGVQLVLDGSHGTSLGVLRDAADGKATCTRVKTI